MGFRAVSLAAVMVVLAVVVSPAAAAPTCGEGAQTMGGVIYGTPCADTIHAGRGIGTVYGEGGDDVIFGGRSNQSLFGGEGNDRLYGGIGDDRLRGGPGNDMLSGGFGADSLDGEAGSDFDRGDATIDKIGDSGPSSDNDTLSFATGVTPGFPNAGNMGYKGFPETASGRGVFIELTKGFANDGLAPSGGGVDEPLEATDFESFETIIGTPFDDFIVGGPGDQTIYGGGGADVLLGGGGADQIYGGAEGDYCQGTTVVGCEFSGSAHEVSTRNPSLIAVGVMAPQESSNPAVYLDGSSGDDEATASFAAGAVTFTLGSKSKGSFDASEAVAGGCESPASGKVVCPLPAPPDAIVLGGQAGDDVLSAAGMPEATSPILLGGDGGDALIGGATEDALVDGPGDDVVSAGGGDDAVPNNGGEDRLDAGPGNDLFISNAVCEGDALDGGEGVDNANWANFNSAVSLDLTTGRAGLPGAGGQPECPSGTLTSLKGLEDLEGSQQDDFLYGDAGSNQLLGRLGSDSYFAAAGNDSILANSGDSDAAIDCGAGFDTAQIDIPTSEYADPAPVECEAIYERPPNSFRPPDTPEEEVMPPPPPPPRDVTPPRTQLLRRPPARVFTRSRRRTVVFAFASNEPGSSFRCRLDGHPIRFCRSPRRYKVGPGRHVVRIFAVDAADNRDRSPIVAVFRVKRRR